MPFVTDDIPYTDPADYVVSVLDTNGDGTGTTNAIGNYATETLFRYNATVNTALNSMTVFAGGIGTVTASNYITLIAPLTNGIGVNVYESDGTPIQTPNPAARVKSTVGWATYAFNRSVDDWGGGENYFSVEFDLTQLGRICLTPGRFFAVILNDDFTGLSVQTFTVQGKKVRI